MMKQKLCTVVDKQANALLKLSHDIHANPELGFEEHKAVAWQVELLSSHGFTIEHPFCDIATSYRAVCKGKRPGPRVAFMAEYDALKGVGHGCGHNIMAASVAGAAIALAKLMPDLAGEICVIGTPAEEGGGGKVLLVERGGFDAVDCAIMMHPSTRNIIGRGSLASVSVVAEFFGRAAHSAAPAKGVNALSALIQLFNSIDVLRQTWRNDARINGIIIAGGQASNIIPEYAAAKFTVRAKTRDYLLSMVEDLRRIAQAASLTTSAGHSLTTDVVYAERYPNRALGEAFKQNMALLGEVMEYPDPNESVGSSDFGNVSLVTPGIHEYLAIAPETVVGHTEEFRAAAISARGDEVVLKAAKGMAMTAFDFLTDTVLRQNVADEFKQIVVANR
jgi:amidohydrolase